MQLKNLVHLRQTLGYNQKDFAEQIGIKQTTYNGYENGIRDPGIDFFVMVAIKYNVSIDYLAGRTNDPTSIGLRKSPTPDEAEEEDECLDEIVEIYHELNTDGKEHLLKTARHCSRDPEYKKRVEDKNAV